MYDSKQMNKKLFIFYSLISIVLLLLTFFIGKMACDCQTKDADINHSDYPLLAKRLFIENPNDTRINFSPLRTSLNDYFSDNEIEGSLYFEYLPTGTSIRISPDQTYTAASLFKLPVAMEFFKSVELNRTDLNKKIVLKEEWLNDGYGSLYQKGAGYELTLKEAVKIMLTDSDNTALRAILDTTDKTITTQERVLGSLDIEFSSFSDGSISIGARSYASFFKCLYFACYNSFENSQKILDILTKTDFNDRIVSGIEDKNVKIAHKIGVFNTQVQSDCGIVYLPGKNYILCIMVEGNNESTTNHFRAISKIIYDFLNN